MLRRNFFSSCLGALGLLVPCLKKQDAIPTHYYDWGQNLTTNPEIRELPCSVDEYQITLDGKSVTNLGIFRIWTGKEGWIDYYPKKNGSYIGVPIKGTKWIGAKIVRLYGVVEYSCLP